MRLKKVLISTLLVSLAYTAQAQRVLSLDSCRALALNNNKELLIGNEKINAAHYTHKAAKTNYLPNFTAEATYLRNQREASILNNDQKDALSNMGTKAGNVVNQASTLIGKFSPELLQKYGPLLSLLSQNLVPAINNFGQSVVDAFRTDTRNVWAGAVTLTQPIYMGGKIRAYDKITEYAEELARQQHRTGMQDVILNTDEAYWQVVSLANKKKLAESYEKLLEKLDSDVQKMIAEGFATKADGLSVRVKLNEAQMTLTKVEDGLSLCRMLLCQICGIDLSTPIQLADEDMEDLPVAESNPQFQMDSVYSNRPEIRSLQLATNIYKEKVNITRADFLPQVALIGNYIVTNPSVYNGFEKKFKGMWNVGVTMKVPIWHWGEGPNKIRAAKAEANIASYQLQDAKEKIELQVNQAAFKVKEAGKKLVMASKNKEKAEENLHSATIGFKEGVIPTSNVLEAQTAWLSAQSEKIDAQIDVKLTEVYLQKSIGTLK